eukprot:COSAG06_NODE_25787_length_628_cov_12.576560_1_plen_131_part_00
MGRSRGWLCGHRDAISGSGAGQRVWRCACVRRSAGGEISWFSPGFGGLPIGKYGLAARRLPGRPRRHRLRHHHRRRTPRRPKNSGGESFSPESIAGLAKAQGQKAKGIEFEPRLGQNFFAGNVTPGGFSR